MDITAKLVSDLREKTGVGMMQCKQALIETKGDIEQAIELLRKQGQATAAKRAGKAAKEGKVAIVTGESIGIMYEVNCETDFVARNDDFLKFIDAIGGILLTSKPLDIAAASTLKSPAINGLSIEEKLSELISKIGEKITFRRFILENVNPDSEKIFTYIHANGKIGVMVKLSADKKETLSSEAVAVLGKELAMQVAAASPVSVSRENVPAALIAKEKEIYLEQVKQSGKPEKIWDKIVEGKLNSFFEESVMVEQKYIRDPEKKVSARIAETEKEVGNKVSVVSFVRWELGADAGASPS